MTAFEDLEAKLRARYPLDADRAARVARGNRGYRLDPALYHQRMAAALAIQWRDQLNDEELGWRRAFEAAVVLEDDTDTAREELRLTDAEIERRKQPKRPQPKRPRFDRMYAPPITRRLR